MNNVLGKYEEYDSSKIKCWDFCKGSDIRDGIELKLGNMLISFPFVFNGNLFKCSEMLYLCGQFSDNNEECIKIQKDIINSNNGFNAKKFIRNNHTDKVRKDFNNFRLEWMLFCVWQKTKNNKDFQKLLLSIPSDATIIENSTGQSSPTATVWGCKNYELSRIRKSVKEEISNINTHLKKKDLEELINIETNKIINVGVFKGENNLGKILMICREALVSNKEPEINYKLLKNYNIYILGEKIF